MLIMSLLLAIAVNTTQAKQEKEIPITEKISVNGNCESCKKNIERAVKVKGVKKANWDADTKTLTITYLASKISNDELQRKIADSGYDTEKYKAPDEVYKNLHACCQYERK